MEPMRPRTPLGGGVATEAKPHRWGADRLRTLAADSRTRSTLAYSALMFFSWIYWFRPEDLIPGLDAVPINKIAVGSLCWRSSSGFLRAGVTS